MKASEKGLGASGYSLIILMGSVITTASIVLAIWLEVQRDALLVGLFSGGAVLGLSIISVNFIVHKIIDWENAKRAEFSLMKLRASCQECKNIIFRALQATFDDGESQEVESRIYIILHEQECNTPINYRRLRMKPINLEYARIIPHMTGLLMNATNWLPKSKWFPIHVDLKNIERTAVEIAKKQRGSADVIKELRSMYNDLDQLDAKIPAPLEE